MCRVLTETENKMIDDNDEGGNKDETKLREWTLEQAFKFLLQ